MLDRLLDLLLIAVLRAWFARPEAAAPGWYRAHADPVVGPALRLLHDDPAHPWTVAELAARAPACRAPRSPAASTSSWASRRWRSSPAGGSRSPPTCCSSPDATVGSVARQVGYGSPFALSTAFKRLRGISPKQYRVAALA